MVKAREERKARPRGGLLSLMALKVQAGALALGAESEGRDKGVFVPVPGDRCLTPGGACPTNARYQEEPRFVNEGDVGAQPRGVFL